MNISRVTAIAAVCGVAAGGTGAAVAATGNDDSSGTSPKPGNCAKPGNPGQRGGPLNDVAAALGIKVSSLQSQLKDGKKLSEIATAQGKTLDQVKTAVKASLKTKLDKAVTAGRITQTQADEQLSRVDTLIDSIEAGKKPARPARALGGGAGGGVGLGGEPPSGPPPGY